MFTADDSAGTPVLREPYPEGEAGIQKSLVMICQKVREGAPMPIMRSFFPLAMSLVVASFVSQCVMIAAVAAAAAEAETPLPAGSTPTMQCPDGYYAKDGVCVPSPLIEGQVPQPPPKTPAPAPVNLLTLANQVAQGVLQPLMPKCPPGFHWGGYDADNPNLPKCIPDCPPFYHWGGYDADNPNLPKCVPDS
jgi:hypothetical protein